MYKRAEKCAMCDIWTVQKRAQLSLFLGSNVIKAGHR